MRKLIAWLNRRFPEQLIVTVEEYQKLQNDFNWLKLTNSDINARILSLEGQVKRLNDQAGYVSTKKGAFSLER